MTADNSHPIVHEDETLFREALQFSAAATRFPARLVEKDYYCTLILQNLVAAVPGLVFKGGTCLAKVHADFYRLSEDLDFSIPLPVEASRTQRSDRARQLKSAILRIGDDLTNMQLRTPMTGANESTQYIGELAYPSVLAPGEEVIKIEVGLREPLLTPEQRAEARTILLDPVTESPMVPPIEVECLSWNEAMAEKLRAALSRREPAIRDFYDIYHAMSKMGLSLESTDLVRLVGAKLAVPGNTDIDVSSSRLAALRAQVEAELEPVLRPADFAEFDLDWTFSQVRGLANLLAGD